MVCFAINFSACKKDRVKPEAIDLENMSGYYLYLSSKERGDKKAIFEFLPGKKYKTYHYSPANGTTLSYEVLSSSDIKIDDMILTIENGKITKNSWSSAADVALIKGYSTNQLAGKKFTGKLYQYNNNTTALEYQSNAVYEFSADGNMYTTNYIDGSFLNSRTQSYTAMGNFFCNNHYRLGNVNRLEQFLVHDNKLIVWRIEPNNKLSFGTLDPQ